MDEPRNEKPLRLLVVMPSWVGDAVMATPALRLLRDSLRGSLIGGLVRPGIDQVLAGSGFFDQVHVERARGIMGPKLVANKVRPVRYDTALLLTNSFSTALITRLAYIPRRVGYDRDGRGVLLTDRLEVRRRADGKGYAPVPAVEYYMSLARAVVGAEGGGAARLELGTTDEEERGAADILERAGVTGARPVAILNPGGNNEAKRWPAERFAAVGAHLIQKYGMDVLINGSPGEVELVSEIAGRVRGVVGCESRRERGEGEGTHPPTPSLREGAAERGRRSGAGEPGGHVDRGGGPSSPHPASPKGRAGGRVEEGEGGETRGFAGDGGEDGGGKGAHPRRDGPTVAELPELGVTLGSLKGIVRRCAVMVTNDTGPRHIAAAFGVPTVALFGPTDPRWTTLPAGTPEVCLVADPTLPESEVADDHPERCRIDRIEVWAVIRAVEGLLARRGG